MTTTESNKLIAEFMGTEWHKEFFKSVCIISPSNIPYKFHTSWEWLMPVVDKIELLGYETSFKTHYARINPKREESSYEEYIVLVRSDGESERRLEQDEAILMDKSTIGLKVLVDGEEYINAINTLINCTNVSSTTLSKKDMIYNAVVEFIKYYNLNK